LLGELTQDARIFIRALADRLNISRPNACSQLERLTGNGVITGFSPGSIRISPGSAPAPTSCSRSSKQPGGQ
jgi:hypothetical protein